MTTNPTARAGDRALLPAGLADLLAPAAREEAYVVERLIAACEAEGYERVKPPLLEFEQTLIAGPGAAVADQTFRLMDPVSQRMLGLRADMTPQVARIAAFRLSAAPRPLRLCYAGQVLRVKGSQLRPERQFGQVGAELIGADGAAADAEACLLAARALLALGVEGLTVDLTLPTLVPLVAEALALPDAQRTTLYAALDRKDAAAVAEAAGAHATPFLAMLHAAGPSPEALGALQALALPPAGAAEVARLVAVAGRINEALPDLVLTVDPVERRGYEYHSGLSFTLFARSVRGELGRGGRYLAERLEGPAEPATGFTLYMDTVQAAVPARTPKRRVFLPAGTLPKDAQRLRDAGWITVADLDAAQDAAGEARRLGCGHVWQAGEPRAISSGNTTDE